MAAISGLSPYSLKQIKPLGTSELQSVIIFELNIETLILQI